MSPSRDTLVRGDNKEAFTLYQALKAFEARSEEGVDYTVFSDFFAKAAAEIFAHFTPALPYATARHQN